MNTKSNALLALVAVIGIALGGVAIGGMQKAALQNEDLVLGSEFAQAIRNFPNDSTATTTLSELTVGGDPVSYILPVESADLFDANLLLNASSTATVLNWTVEYSWNYNNTTGSGDWYGSDVKSVTTATTTRSAATNVNTWAPATAGISRKNFSVDPVATKYARFTFWVTGDDGDIRLDTVIRKPISR